MQGEALRAFWVAAPCFRNGIAEDGADLGTLLQPALLEMCSARGKGVPEEGLDSATGALPWGRVIGNGGWSLKSSSAPR